MGWIIRSLLQALPGIGVASVLAPVIASYLVKRRLEKDRWRYQTHLETLLQDLRTRTSKEIFIHQLQFDKEFQIYLDLWKEALALGRAASEFRELKPASGKSPDEELEVFKVAYSRFLERVFDYRPFYAPEIHELSRGLLGRARTVRQLNVMRQGGVEPMEQSEELLDGINAMIDPLCDAIRRRIWSRDTVDEVTQALPDDPSDSSAG